MLGAFYIGGFYLGQSASTTSSFILIVQDSLHSASVDNVTLQQNHFLAIAEATHTIISDNALLAIAGVDAWQLQTADNVIVSVKIKELPAEIETDHPVIQINIVDARPKSSIGSESFIGTKITRVTPRIGIITTDTNIGLPNSRRS